MNTTPLRLRVLAVGIVGLVALAACADADTDTGSPAATPATTEATLTADGTEAPTESANVAATPSSVAGLPDSLNSDYLGSYELMDTEFGTMVTVTVSDDTRTIVSNSLPDHETGQFPNAGNPNSISEQALVFEFSTTPALTESATLAQTPGVAVNGITMEPGTGESVTCADGSTYRVEAQQDIHDLGLDFNNAHVQPGGQYHYHGVSQLLVDAYASDQDLVHVGFAADGHLMYYSKSGAFQSSYRLSDTDRTGTSCVVTGPDDSAFDLAGTAPDGTYVSDWAYVAGAGDLDECNGTAVDGQYVYLLTDTYPYIPRCLMGDFDGAGPGSGPGGGPNDPAGPDLSAAATALGVTEDELRSALGGPPPDLEAAAQILGVSVAELAALIPVP